MRKLFFGIALLSLVSCAKKKWDKETVKADFMKELKKNERTKILSEDVMTKISDCAAEKMTTKYKSENEADKDKSGVAEIMTTCTLEAMGMGGDKPTDMTPMDDTPDDKPTSDTTDN